MPGLVMDTTLGQTKLWMQPLARPNFVYNPGPGLVMDTTMARPSCGYNAGSGLVMDTTMARPSYGYNPGPG